MLELDQYKTTLGTLKEPLEEVKGSLDLAGKQNRVIELEKMMEEPTFWNDAEKAAKITTELKNTKDTVKKITDLAQEYEDIGMMIELAYEEDDEETTAEVGRMLERFADELETLRMSTLLNGEFDDKNAIVADQRAECLRLHALRARHPPAGTHFAFQCPGQAPDQLRVLRRHAGH